MTNIEDRNPFSHYTKKRRRKKKTAKVRFDKLYNRIQDLINTDSSIETNTITLNELAEALNMHPQTLRGWIHRGIITPRRTERGKIFFRKEDFIPELFQADGVYTPKEVAKLIKRPVSHIYRILKAGELSARKYGNRWFITKDDLQEYFDAGVGLI